MSQYSPLNSVLAAHHWEELTSLGLSEDTIRDNQIQTASDPEVIAASLNCVREMANRLSSVMLYPHFDLNGNPIDFVVAKPDKPRIDGNSKEKIQYENPKGKPARVYIPKEARASLLDLTSPLLITTGCNSACIHLMASVAVGRTCRQNGRDLGLPRLQRESFR